MKRVVVVAAYMLGVYLVVRAVAEPFVLDIADPTTYRDDWGGPSLAGGIVVHCLPGIVAAVLMARHLWGGRAPSRAGTPR